MHIQPDTRSISTGGGPGPDLTDINIDYQNQPLPNELVWAFEELGDPRNFHKDIVPEKKRAIIPLINKKDENNYDCCPFTGTKRLYGFPSITAKLEEHPDKYTSEDKCCRLVITWQSTYEVQTYNCGLLVECGTPETGVDSDTKTIDGFCCCCEEEDEICCDDVENIHIRYAGTDENYQEYPLQIMHRNGTELYNDRPYWQDLDHDFHKYMYWNPNFKEGNVDGGWYISNQLGGGAYNWAGTSDCECPWDPIGEEWGYYWPAIASVTKAEA